MYVQGLDEKSLEPIMNLRLNITSLEAVHEEPVKA